MVEVKLTAKIDDAGLNRYSKAVSKRLQRGSKRYLDDNLKFLAARARLYAAFKTGALRKGIFITRRLNARTAKGGRIRWKELDKRREASFERSNWGSFINWLHNSPSAAKWKWESGEGMPDFMTFTVNRHEKEVIKNARSMIDKTIRGK